MIGYKEGKVIREYAEQMTINQLKGTIEFFRAMIDKKTEKELTDN